MSVVFWIVVGVIVWILAVLLILSVLEIASRADDALEQDAAERDADRDRWAA